MKFIFTPFSILAGLLAGMVGKKIFEVLWGLIDDEEPPRPEQREVPWPKLVMALVFEGRSFECSRALLITVRGAHSPRRRDPGRVRKRRSESKWSRPISASKRRAGAVAGTKASPPWRLCLLPPTPPAPKAPSTPRRSRVSPQISAKTRIVPATTSVD